MTDEQFWIEIRRGLVTILKAVESKIEAAKTASKHQS